MSETSEKPSRARATGIRVSTSGPTTKARLSGSRAFVVAERFQVNRDSFTVEQAAQRDREPIPRRQIRLSSLEVALYAQAAFPDVFGSDSHRDGSTGALSGDRDPSAGINFRVDGFHTDLETAHRRPDGIGSEAVLVEVDEANAGARDPSRNHRHDSARGTRELEPGIGAEQARADCRGPVVSSATGDRVRLRGFEIARQRVDIGVREGKA